MSSELKLTNIKHPSSGSNNLVLASDGSATATLSSASVVPASVGSSMVLIKSITASDADTEILFQHNINGVVIDSTYTNYMLFLEGVTVTTDGKHVYVTVGNSGGYDNTCVGGYHFWKDDASTASVSAGNLSRSYFWNSGAQSISNNTSIGGLNGSFILYNVSHSNKPTYAFFNVSYYASNAYFYGMYGTTTTRNDYAVDRIKLSTNSDSFKSGSKVSLYGIKNA
jgi:hypothetical protein